jgi:hypothetical protein
VICKRCGGRAVHIGISGAAELVCARDCKGKCPTCLSADVEPFVTYSYGPFGPIRDHKVMHCKPHGHVWEDREP